MRVGKAQKFTYLHICSTGVSAVHKSFSNTEKLRESSLMQLLAACSAAIESLGFYHSRVSSAEEPHVSLHAATAQLLIC